MLLPRACRRAGAWRLCQEIRARQAQPYVLRVQFPANYRIAPHSHPVTENATVMSGTVALGMGDKWDDAAMQDVGPEDLQRCHAGMRHFFISKTASTLQLHGMGPFGITYVNPADDPRTKKLVAGSW